jgi:outer membrane receptor protein involved in Fe transport
MGFTHRWGGRCVAAAVIVCVAAASAAAGAQTAPAAPAAAESASPAPAAAGATTTVLQGAVRSGTGLPVAGASVRASGPSTSSTTTDASGTFTLTVPQGIYTITVRRPGYNPAVLSNIVAVGGTSVPVSVTIAQQDLSSLRTIGSVTSTSRGGGSSINTGAASSSFVPAQAFANVANPQINDVLQRVPDVTLQHMGSQPDVSIVLGGVQPYETQVLIDGHPLALGQFGVWTSQYFPSYLIGGLETQSGPGNTTPFANIAVGGTVNILTPNFTTRPSAEITYGVDNYSSQYSNFLVTGAAAKLQVVAGAGVGSINGPYYQTDKCIVTPSFGGANDNRPGNTGVVQYCGDASGSFFSKGELLKARYNFSPATSFDVGFTGAWGGYQPQGTAWGTYLGATTILPCLPPSSATDADSPQKCTNPANANLVGKTINAYGWYTGSSVYNNQWLYNAQLRTTLGNNTLLIRPYIGDIEPEVITGGDTQASYPNFFSPVGAASDPAALAAFETACGDVFGNLTSPTGQTVTKNGQRECFNSAYQTYEQDKLYGTTFSILHPFGNNLLNLSYDFHGQSTFAYINSPADISVPFSTDRFSTFSLTGSFVPIKNISLNVGLYDTLWKVVGVQRVNPTSLTDTSLTGLNRSVSRFDPHFAVTFRPTGDVSYRAAVGSSATFPFVGQVSGLATYEQPAASLGPPFASGGTLTQKNPNLEPEVSTSYNVGADKRFSNNSVLSIDLQDGVIHNVFEQLTSSAIIAGGGLEGIFTPINVGRLRTELATVRYSYAPRAGLGVNAAVAANRSILDGVPLGVGPFVANVPANGVQICGNGVAAPGIATCLPYLKGYGQINYTTRSGSFLGLGVEYEGKNNSYFQPPFALVDFTFRRPVSRSVEMLVGVENLLNTNVYSNASYLASPNAGTPLVANTAAGGQTSFVPTLVSAPARTVRVQVRLHTGR